MQITCNHPASQWGVPVILDDGGELMGYAEGLTAVLERLEWTRAQFAEHCGYKSSRSVEKFWQGVVPPAATLNMLAIELEYATNQQDHD